jgi:hypothetical protein
MHVTNAHQGADIGFVRLGGQWITEEKHGQHMAFGDLCPDLLVATQGTRKHAGDLEAGEFGKDRTGGAGGNQGKMTKDVAVIKRESREVVFFLVMCDQRDQALTVIHASNIAEKVEVALPPKVGVGSGSHALYGKNMANPDECRSRFR